MVPSMTTLEVTCVDICRWQLGIDEDDGALTPIACYLTDKWWSLWGGSNTFSWWHEWRCAQKIMKSGTVW